MDIGLLEEVVGGADLLAWFGGRVPSFHDAEVLGLSLDRHGATCRLSVHTFEMTQEVDNGQYVMAKHIVVAFELSGVTELNLSGFNHQNVIYGLSLTRKSHGGFCLELQPCWGISGDIEARDVKISLEPGMPSGSQYMALGRSDRGALS